MKEKNKVQFFCRKNLILNGVSYLNKDFIYFLTENESWLNEHNPSTHLVYDQNDELVFTINTELIDEYFMNMAEYRDDRINLILE